MDSLLYRVRATALWLIVAIALLASLVLYLFMPGAVEELAAGEMEGEALTDVTSYFLAALGLIPLVMVSVTLLVTDRVSRSANLIVGLVLGLFGVFGVVSHLLADGFNVHVLMVAVAAVGSFMIAGLSFAWLRHPVSGPASPESETGRFGEAATA